MIETILQEALTTLNAAIVAASGTVEFTFDTGSAVDMENHLAQQCSFPLVWMYPEMVKGKAPKVGVWLDNHYSANIDVVMDHKPQDPRSLLKNRHQYMFARSMEFLNAIKDHEDVDHLDYDMVKVQRGAEVYEKAEAHNGFSRALVGWSINVKIKPFEHTEMNYCTGLSASTVGLSACP